MRMRALSPILILLVTLKANSQITVSNSEPFVGIVSKPIMYYNIDNPIIISNGNKKKLNITVKNGSIRPGEGPGKYLVRHEPTNEYNPYITVIIESGKESREFQFILTPIPYLPKLEFAGPRNEDYVIVLFRQSTGLVAYMKDFTFPVSFNIDSFSVTFEDSVSLYSHVNKGAIWDSISKKRLKNALPGTLVTVTCAWLKGTSNSFYVKQELVGYIR